MQWSKLLNIYEEIKCALKCAEFRNEDEEYLIHKIFAKISDSESFLGLVDNVHIRYLSIDEKNRKVLLKLNEQKRLWTIPYFSIDSKTIKRSLSQRKIFKPINIKYLLQKQLLKELYLKVDYILFNPPFYIAINNSNIDSFTKEKTSGCKMSSKIFTKNNNLSLDLWVKINLTSDKDFNRKEALENGYKWLHLDSLAVNQKIVKALGVRMNYLL
jgi:hypothetical protein